jgi:hypothetical protein
MSERGLMCGRRPGGCCRLKFAFTSAAAPEHKLEHKKETISRPRTNTKHYKMPPGFIG